MAESLEERDKAVESSAGEPGPLSRLLQELFGASSDGLLDAWKSELKPGDRLGRFEIRHEVGRGGFGAVYEAFDTELSRVVAVKTLQLSRPRRDLASDWIKKEAEAVARLDHPCIVTLFDVGTCDSGPYLVMELLRGKTLSQRIAEGPVPVAEALRIAGEIAKGLAHAHQRGVLHRDLKPANVFLCEDGRVKLLDFGLAHLLGTEGVSRAGTPMYMAPEQARGEEVDQRADVYAAGRVLGEMLGERRPRRLERAIALATSTDPAARTRDGQAWLDILQAARHAVERPARVRHVAVVAGLALVIGGVIVGVTVHRAPRPATAHPGSRTIAVLPFTDMSPDHDQEYFAEGVAEEILNGLSQVPGLKVIGRTSSFSFKGKDEDLRTIGQKLNAGTILEGSVRTDGGRLRITAKLIRAEDGTQLWSKVFDRNQAGVFAAQEEIARSVASELRIALIPSLTMPIVRPDAYNKYLLGKQFAQQGTVEGYRRALEAFRDAVKLDPGFAQAQARMADVTRWASSIVGQRSLDRLFETHRQALAEADRAVEMGPGVPDGYLVRALIRSDLFFDWDGARADLEKARQLGPPTADFLLLEAEVLSSQGQVAPAIERLRQAVELEPLYSRVWSELGFLLLAAKQPAAAREAFRRGLEIAPDAQWPTVGTALTELLTGNVEAALGWFQRAPLPQTRLQGLALCLDRLGRRVDADRALEDLIREYGLVSAWEVAQVYAARGDRDAAFEWLVRAYQQHDGLMAMVKFDPLLDSVRGDPRYAELLRKMNLPVD